MQLAPADLDFSLRDSRRIPPPPRADQALEASIRARGVLQAITVRPYAGKFQVVLGRRRARACIALGLPEIPAQCREMTDLEAMEAQLIENLQREGMHPIDQWKGTKDLLDAGASVEDAAMALGLDTRSARRMALLARLHPDVEALILTDMPNPKALAAIAYASPDQQAKALKAPYAVSPGGEPNWIVIGNACRQTAIPRGFAIFDVDKAGVPFEEDLFAEPGAPDQFVTHDIAAFMAAQTAALERRVEKARARGERVQLTGWGAHGIKPPPGMAIIPGFQSTTPPTEDSGRVLLLAIDQSPGSFGAVREVIARQDEAAAPPRGRASKGGSVEGLTSDKGRAAPPSPASEAPARPAPRAIALRGEIPPRQQEPLLPATPAPPPGTRIAASAATDARRRATRDPDVMTGPVLDPKKLTKRGRLLVAYAKTAALHEHVRNPPGAFEGLSLLARCLVLALAADNVHVYASRNVRTSFRDLVEHLVDPAGNMIEMPDADLLGLMGEALARLLKFNAPPDEFGSGPIAEYIGRAVDVSPPRLDIADVSRHPHHRSTPPCRARPRSGPQHADEHRGAPQAARRQVASLAPRCVRCARPEARADARCRGTALGRKRNGVGAWAVVVEVRVRKTLTFRGLPTEDSARAAVTTLLSGELDIESFVKLYHGRIANGPTPPETIRDNDPMIVSVRKVAP